jgi:hypothetical protein
LRNEEEIMQQIDNKVPFYNNVIIPYKGKLEAWFVDNYSIANYFKVVFATIIIILRPSSHIWMKIFSGLPPIPKSIESIL